MKCNMASMLLGSLGMILPIAPLYVQGEVVNGNFENGFTGWTPANAVLDTYPNAFMGSYCARLDHASYFKQCYQDMPCSSLDAPLSTAFVLRTQSSTSPASLAARFLDSTGNVLQITDLAVVQGTIPYTSHYADGLIPPANTATLRLMFSSGSLGSGASFLDNVSVVPTPNVISVNGGFENGFTGWAQVNGILDNGIPYGGTYCARLDHASYFKQCYQDMPCTASAVLTVSFALCTEEATSSASVAARFLDSAGNVLQITDLAVVQGTMPYTNYTEDLVPPANTATLRLMFSTASLGTGSSFLDDVVVTNSTGQGGTPTPTPTPTPNPTPNPTGTDQQVTPLFTANTDFESGTTDWLSQYVLITTDPAHVASGAHAGYVNSANYFIFWPLRGASAQPGHYYRLRAKLHTTGMLVKPDMTLRFLDSAGDTISAVSITDETLIGSRPYKEYISGHALAPAGTDSIKVYVGIPANAGGTLYYDDVSLEEVTSLPVRAVATYTSASVYVAKVNPAAGEVARFYYRKQGNTAWLNGFTPIYDAVRGEYRGSLIGLAEDTVYEIQVALETNGVVSAQSGVTLRTWSSSPPIAATYTVASLYTSGQLKIENLHGSPTGWIKIVGTGVNDVSGGYNTTAGADFGQAILIKNCDYLILDNVRVTGGRLNGIEIRNCDQVRVSRCDISGWARQPNVVSGGLSYESSADVTARNPINYDAGIFLNTSTRVTLERCYLHDPRLGSNPWSIGHPAGATGIYVKNTLETGNNVVRYNDVIGGHKLRWNDSIEGEANDAEYGSFCRDSDIYGNMFALGNDDAIELDGGQKNIRFFGNRIEGSYSGVSLAPNTVGPDYIYRNFAFNMGDQENGLWATIKAGGGTTYSKGKSFFFHNTMYANCNILAGVGYGSDSNRAMFLGLSRNNIFYSLNSAVNYRNTISDSNPNAWSTFDYDNLASATLPSAQVAYAAGQEAHGKLNSYPTFVDAAGGDFRPATGSSAINGGQAQANFAEVYASTAPDQGALEVGDSSLMPIRPIAITASKYLVTLTATGNGGSTTSVSVTLTTGNLGGATGYTVRKNSTDTSWLSITPVSGTLQNNSTQTVTFSVATAGLAAGQRKAVVLIQLANGFSVPISITANVN